MVICTYDLKSTNKGMLKRVWVLMFSLILIAISSAAFGLSTVTLTLVDGEAAELEQDAGSFTVTRTDDGNTAQSLVLRVHLSGTAIRDVDYLRLGMDEISVGVFNITIFGSQLSRTITLTPILDNLIEDDETISIQLKDIGVAYTVAEENSIELVIADYVELMFKDGFENPET